MHFSTCFVPALRYNGRHWGDENERRKKKRVRLRFRKKNKGDFYSCLPPRFCPPNPTCLSFFFFLCPTLFIDDNQVEKERYFFNRKTIMKWKKGGRLGFCLQKNKSRKLWKKERREDSFSFATIKNAIERPRHQGRPRRSAALAQKKKRRRTFTLENETLRLSPFIGGDCQVISHNRKVICRPLSKLLQETGRIQVLGEFSFPP